MKRFFTYVMVVAILLIIGCGQPTRDEPPFSLGQGGPGSLIRNTQLVRFDPAHQQAVYEIRYPNYNLVSEANLGLVFKELTKEVFKDRWTVMYLYDDNMHKALQLPNSIEVYRYISTGDHRGMLINIYKLGPFTTQGQAEYTDREGREITVSMTYLSIMPSGT